MRLRLDARHCDSREYFELYNDGLPWSGRSTTCITGCRNWIDWRYHKNFQCCTAHALTKGQSTRRICSESQFVTSPAKWFSFIVTDQHTKAVQVVHLLAPLCAFSRSREPSYLEHRVYITIRNGPCYSGCPVTHSSRNGYPFLSLYYERAYLLIIGHSLRTIGSGFL
jgi:hypothetical protein